jgi:S1-C subfamily serine protease
MRHVGLVTFLAIVLLSICSILASGIPSADAADHLPSMSELETLSFTAAEAANVPDPPYTEVSAVRGLFLAYKAGAEAVSKYRDPVLTRGTSGITVFKSVSPSVVVVVVGSIKDDKFNAEGMGTGAIVDPRGYVLTNWHVIQGYSTAGIFLKPNTGADLANAECRVARVVYQDSGTDLALLKIIDPPSTLRSISVGDIGQIQVAEDIHIIGHPHGNLWSYSTGVVSQIRDGYSWTYEDGSKHLAKVLQLQTAINPGNSGGPVVDDAGEILGLVAMSEEGQNLDYAIAADVIKRFLLTGMQVTTRGVDKSITPSKPPQQVFSGKVGDSLLVSKAVFSDMVLYSIDGKDSGLVAKFDDGTIVRAWNANAIHEFRSWSAKLPNGKELVATASNGTLTHIGMGQ